MKYKSPLQRMKGVVPVAMKLVRRYVEGRHLRVGYLLLRRVLARIQDAADFEAGRGRRTGDEVDDRRMGEQGLSSPVLADEGKQPVFDLVPLARSRRKMAHRDWVAKTVRQALQFPFPQTHPRPVASAAVGDDEQGAGLRIAPAP